ncbi:hypothetical protein OPV22_006661 [Ensete ventricosum]|uniref:Uncharacterized protein n=1 Tax=Ensete ventricosum TaxID=4639 RepID=A0AAV8RRM7_ENSVE|nr:hypothetical protein OPV22_006661 [Ensete ventricosum]
MASCAVNHLLSELSEEDEAVAYQKEWERKSKRRTKLAAQLTLPQAAEIAQSGLRKYRLQLRLHPILWLRLLPRRNPTSGIGVRFVCF